MKSNTSKRRLLTVVMDGVGVRDSQFGNAVALAMTPNMHFLKQNGLYATLQAHGKAVGLPSDSDLGNSEVGHNAIGAGRVFDQGAKLVNEAIASGAMFNDQTWKAAVTQCIKAGSTLHFIGLLSDGNVHSHEDHLYAMMRHAKSDGVKKIRIHVLFDGRDVAEKSAEKYVANLERVISELNDSQCSVAVGSGGGRMRVTMDRYEADWAMVDTGWKAHVLGVAPLKFRSLGAALLSFRLDNPLTDQYLPAFTIVDAQDRPQGVIQDNDAVIFFNFRGDRALEISRAFTEENFAKFDRVRVPKIYFAGMMQYDGDLHIPEHFLVRPPLINDTLSEFLVSQGVRQFACSETQKYGHVTYFWNGNRTNKFDQNLEEYLEIASDRVDFDQKPWMKAYEITEATMERMGSGSFDFARINYANGDMVGHTGNLEAAVIAVETVDMMLGHLIQSARDTDTVLMITADHGNCDEMFDAKEKDFPQWRDLPLDKRPTPKTAHTLAPVPFYLFDPKGESFTLRAPTGKPGLANIANTVLTVLGMPERDSFLPGLVVKK